MKKKNVKNANTSESQTSKLIAESYNLAADLIRSGKANQQIILFFLKEGSKQNSLLTEKMQGEIDLLKAKIESLSSEQAREASYDRLISALRTYQGINSE